MTTPGSILSDVITWVRRIVKTPSDLSITDATIREYINRFYLFDMPARLQLFELKRQYSLDTIANQNVYTFPPRDVNNAVIQDYPLILPPVYCNGTEIGYFQSNFQFYRAYPEQMRTQQPIVGDGTVGAYAVTADQTPIMRSHRDVAGYPLSPTLNATGYLLPKVIISAVAATGDTVYLVDDGAGILKSVNSSFQFDVNDPGIDAGFVDYITGDMGFSFPIAIPVDNPITVQTVPYTAGRPIAMLFFDNYLKFFPVPDRPWNIVFDVQITPTIFLSEDSAVPFIYMAEYLARGAARKLLSDQGDIDQLNIYEPFFREQETFVLRRTNRQQSVERTPTIFSSQAAFNFFPYGRNNG